MARLTTTVLAEDLVKTYGDVTALAGLSLAVPQGSVLGVLGPNGAGKTTTVRVLTTLLRPCGGGRRRRPGRPARGTPPNRRERPVRRCRRVPHRA